MKVLCRALESAVTGREKELGERHPPPPPPKNPSRSENRSKCRKSRFPRFLSGTQELSLGRFSSQFTDTKSTLEFEEKRLRDNNYPVGSKTNSRFQETLSGIKLLFHSDNSHCS